MTPDSVIREILDEGEWTTESWPLVVSITRTTTGDFGYTNFESTSYRKVHPDVLKPSDVAVETAFVPFLSYFSAVLENTSGIFSLILLAWTSGP